MESIFMITLVFCLWNSFGATVLGQTAQPTNLHHVVVTNSCISTINLKWTRPNTTWEVRNYIIAYWTKPFNNINSTIKTETIVIANGNRTEKNITISGSNVNAYFKISANFSSGNGTYSTGLWSKTITVIILTSSCNSTKIDENSVGRGTAYVVKLVSIVIGASVGIMIIFFAVLRIYVWRKEKRYNQNDLSREEKRGHQLLLIDHELPVSVDSFCDHVSSMKFNTSKGFHAEWAILSTSTNQPFSFGNRPFNASKNRYTNVPTFDRTRVVLEQQSDKQDSTYINANFVDCIEHPKAYIATQAPLHETISDFWRMIWEQEVRHIVMIANLREQENIACCKYWPNEGEYTYGKVTVKMLEFVKYADYSIRRFEIRCKGSTEFRLISQFHYHSWPTKMAVPVHPTSFLEFVKTVALYRVNSVQPVVVHCSSGNGRTGVFIAVDSQLKRINSQNNVNIFFNVDLIRHQRHQIIRNVEEYIFIHECILDHVTCMDRIDIIPRNLADVIAEQKEVNEGGVTKLQKEFDEVLIDATTMHNKSTYAELPHNKSKNRFENILPYDHTRVKLRKGYSVSSDGHDFINANYCSGMRKQRSYIITQNPMESTIFDFWCMVWENSSLTIVMLSYQEEDIISYWPEESEVLKAGKIEVRCISVEKQKNFDIRLLEMSHNETDANKLVRQYQYKGYIENSNEDSIKSYVDFIVQCNKWHHTSKCRTMIVHCRAGTGKSGTFVAISQLMEKLDVSNTINVFKTVKRLLQDRMAVIQTLNQYELLYLAMEFYYKMYYLVRHEHNDLEEESTQTSINDLTMM